MNKVDYRFSNDVVSCYFDADFKSIDTLAAGSSIIFVTDENVFSLHKEKFQNYPTIKIPAGEANKNQVTADFIIAELIRLEANKDTMLIAVGGGVVTDITGYVASVYMRGIRCGLVPTSILAMVDAAIGGKNGIDAGLYKNMIGTIRQPDFIFYDYSFLETLPVKEWINGFAEIIKHACIKDAVMFAVLERYSLHDYQNDKTLIADLVEKNVAIKSAIVASDEFEKGDRKLLNFGHTIGHAIENLHGIPHGHAISIGMVAACNLSEEINGFHFSQAEKIVKLLNQYQLPVDLETDHEKVFEILKMDKKRKSDGIHFILLKNIGHAQIKFVPLTELQSRFKDII